MNRGRFLLGTVVGAVAGVVAGILAAPKSGKETRADLKGKAAELKENAARRTENMTRRGKRLADDVEEAVEEYHDLGERAVDDAKRKFG
jgi:gas vesicle protein